MTTFTDRLAPQADWRTTHRIADVVFPRLRAVVMRALTRAQIDTMWANVERYLAMYDATQAVHAIDLGGLADVLTLKAMPLLTNTMVRAGGVTYQRRVKRARRALLVKETVPRLGETQGSAFKQTNPYAQAWATQRSAHLVTSITAQTRKALQQYIGDAFKRGVPPRLLAKQLRAIVGLTDKQAASIGRMRDEWLDEGLSDDVVERRVEFESAKALKVRTEMIARTETIAASNAGQRIAWQQARSEGLLSPDLVKVWITTPDDRTCSECEAIDGEQANIDSPFSIGVVEPPAHPNCRCAVGLERAGTWLPPEEEEA